MATVTGEGSVWGVLEDTKGFVVIRVSLFLSVFFSLSVCLSHLTICRSMCLFLSVKLTHSLCISLSPVSLSLYLSLPRCLSLSLCHALFHRVVYYLSLSISDLRLPFSVSIFLNLSLSLTFSLIFVYEILDIFRM